MRVPRVARRLCAAAHYRLRGRASAVASLLRACAATLEELVLDELRAAMLPPSAVFPRLARVRETRLEPWRRNARSAECMCLLRAAPSLTQWFAVAGEVSVLALVCDALRCTAAQMRAFELIDYRCRALRRLDAEFTGLLASLAKQGLLDTPCMARCFIFDGIGNEVCMALTTLLHAALDARSLELVALLPRAGANPTLVVQGVQGVQSEDQRERGALITDWPAERALSLSSLRTPLARALHELRAAMDDYVARVEDRILIEAMDRAASLLRARFAVASLLAASVARARGAEAVAAAAPGDDVALALFPRCAPMSPILGILPKTFALFNFASVCSISLRFTLFHFSCQPLAPPPPPRPPGRGSGCAGTPRSWCRCCARAAPQILSAGAPADWPARFSSSPKSQWDLTRATRPPRR